ncbi:dTDP-glucose 4,6-dehydratase [Kineococcus glutinatus]|uniref:dTDP-glucose 4,6-dehydratase n=1 Tax=Kineococcus glutinatus TaxID=1070872 RepID=A0ABP9I159_9ACTN
MRILVTGAAGFIGSQYVRAALSGEYPDLTGAEVVVLDKLTYAGSTANLAGLLGDERLTFVRGDVADPDDVAEAMAGCAQVVHFAAESHVDRSIDAARDFVVTNVLGTQTLLEQARRQGVERFVHVSTDEVYGSIETGSWAEGQPLDPRSPYAASKAGSDLLALAYARTHDLPVVVTRCSNNYGPHQFPEKLVPLFVTNLLDGLPVPLYGDGSNVRDWLHVSDHCRGIELVRAGGRTGETYHIGGGTELTNRELVQRLLDACGRDWGFVREVPDRPGHDRRYSLDIGRISAELGYAPRVGLDEGLAETVRWYEEHESWWRPLKAAAGGARHGAPIQRAAAAPSLADLR